MEPVAHPAVVEAVLREMVDAGREVPTPRPPGEGQPKQPVHRAFDALQKLTLMANNYDLVR